MAPRGKAPTTKSTTGAAASNESNPEESTMKASKARAKPKGAGSSRRKQVTESRPAPPTEDDNAAKKNAAVRKAWLPHFQRLVNNPRYPVDRIVQDVLKELEQIDLATQLEDLEITSASSETASSKIGDATSEALLHFLDCAVVSETEDQESVARTIQLIVGVAARTGNLRAVLNRALAFSETIMERVRCQALLVMQQIVEVISLPGSGPTRQSRMSDATTQEQTQQEENDILDAISEALTMACTDKSKLVRNSAVTACGALLALDTVEAEVLQSVIWVAQHDTFAPNRVAAVNALPLTAETTEVVVARVRDAAPSVRVAALTKLHRLDALDAELAAAIVQAGYTERCPETRKATEELVIAWLDSLDGDVVQLLQVLNATTFEPQCETVVKILLQFASRQNSSTLSDRLLQALSDMFPAHPEKETSEEEEEEDSALSVEAIFLARVISKEDPTFLDKLDLDITQVTSLLERQIRKLKAQLLQDDDDRNEESEDYNAFVCQQLTLLSSSLASNEEGAARHLRQVLEQILADPGTPDALISTAMQAMYSPLQSQGAVSDGRVRETTESVLNCIQGLRNAREENASLREYYEMRILAIWAVLLEHVPVMSHELDELVRDVLEPVLLDAFHEGVSLEQENDSAEYAELVREAAVSCLGKLGLLLLVSRVHHGIEWLDLSRVEAFRRQLVAVASNDSCGAEIRAQALMSLGDWAVVASEEDSGSLHQALDELIPSFLEHDDTFLMCVAGEVAVKLLFAHKMLQNSKRLLARLVLLSLTADYAHGQQPSDADRDIGSPNRLQQLLSYFFVAFAATEHGRIALLGTLSTVWELSKKTPSRIVDYVCDVARQGLAVDPSFSESDCVVDIVSVQAATELATYLLRTQPTGAFLLAISKSMGSLSFLKDGSSSPVTHTTLPTETQRLLISLHSKVEELGMSFDDRRALTEFGRIQEALAAFRLESADDEGVSAHDEDTETEEEQAVESSSDSGTDSDDDESTASSRSSLNRTDAHDLRTPSSTEELTQTLSLTDFFSNKENTKESADVRTATPTEQASTSATHKRRGTRKSSVESVFESLEAQDSSSGVKSVGLSSTEKEKGALARQRTGSSRSSRSSARERNRGSRVGDSLLSMLEQEE